MANKNKYTLIQGNITDAGIQKEFNSDAILDFKILNGHIFLVCDGHDGENGHGALASKLAADSIKKYFYKQSYKEMNKALSNAVVFSNYTLFNQANKDEKYNGIGSTIAIVIYYEDKIHYAYAGDSRIYLYKNDKLQLLTRDHVEDINSAKDSRVEVLLGKQKDIKFGLSRDSVLAEDGDLLLVCTDGLTDSLTDDEIQNVLADKNMSPEHKCVELVGKANEISGSDNVSMQIFQVVTPVDLLPQKKTINIKRFSVIAIAVIIALFLSFGAYFSLKYFANSNSATVAQENPVERVIEPVNNNEVDIENDSIQEVDVNVIQNTEVDIEKDSTQETDVKIIENEEPKPQKVSNEPVFYNHKVVSGDNLYRLAINYNTTQSRLKELNGKKATNLEKGSVLKIPVTAIYKVQSGDSYSVVSDKFNIKIKEICDLNKTNADKPLKEGQVLVIPKSKN